MSARPVVLCFSGHDPCGGAGLQADIETLFSLQCHAVSVLTCLTEQDSHNVKRVLPQAAAAFRAQAATLIADMPVAAVKIGLIGDAQIALAIAELLRGLPGIPVVLDPILAAGGGRALAGQALKQAMIEELLPLTTLLTPNSIEARSLGGSDDLHVCADQLLAWGAQSLLITGTHDDTEQVQNRWYAQAGAAAEVFHWQRLPHSYHGSGCTLASAVAGLLAQGLDGFNAVNEAQEFVWQSLQAGFKLGGGQHQPERLFWALDG
jgi:hydroxymethylpyrimidine/phosphomethylpyrimidine kinase